LLEPNNRHNKHIRTKNQRTTEPEQRVKGQENKSTNPAISGIRKVILALGNLCNLVAEIDNPEHFEVLYTDFAEIRYANGKCFLMLLLDRCSKYNAVGQLVNTLNTALALRAWDAALDGLEILDVPVEGIIVHHDRDSVYTSYA